MKVPRQCFSCETGTIRATNLRGRAFDYRDRLGLIFDQDLEVPVCDKCNEMLLGQDSTKQFSAVLERLRVKEQLV